MPALPTQSPDSALALFRQKIAVGRRAAGRHQQELAVALGLSPYALSHKLHGTGGAQLTHPEVKQIIKTLASWEAITTEAEAIELLALMGLKPESFSAAEWAMAPLNRLEQTAQTAIVPAPVAPQHLLSSSQAAMPAPLTTLIGREELIALVSDRLRQGEVRLLTLLGPGGVGKTRVGLAVAQLLRADFADGVYVVALAAVRDSAWVPSAIAQTLGITETTPESGTRTYAELVPDFLAEKQLLLVLDNVEQILEAAPFLGTLLAAAPSLKLLITSRAVVHLSGEHVIGVPPLAFPRPHHLPELTDLAQFPAIQLFVERAQAAHASFTLTEQNASFVVQICARLDGLPLAIELAAARIRLFPPRALLVRLDKCLDLLKGGPRDLPMRQQTLRATLAWSYELLSEREQALFRRLAVFVGGCTIEAIEAVSAALDEASDNLLEWLESLLDQSLIQQNVADEREPRLIMLETIREYALYQLEQRGEVAAARQRHLEVCLALAEGAARHLGGGEQQLWLRRLEREHDNLRAALQWAEETGQIEQLLRLSAALELFWYRRHQREGRRWLAAALDVTPSDDAALAPQRAGLVYDRGVDDVAGRLRAGHDPPRRGPGVLSGAGRPRRDRPLSV